MRKVPQDVIERLFEADKFGQFSDDFDQPLAKSIRLDIKTLLAQLRAQRSNAEPVAWMNPNENYAQKAFCWPDNLFTSKHIYTMPLYTAPPDYDAGFAAGMMMAAEIARMTSQETSCRRAADRILSAIPADSKAALREVCMRVAKQIASDGSDEALQAIINADREKR